MQELTLVKKTQFTAQTTLYKTLAVHNKNHPKLVVYANERFAVAVVF